jgi:hypothetical protein
MKVKLPAIITSLILLFNLNSSVAQDYSQQGKLYFSGYLSTKAMSDLISNSLPTLEDCKLIFKGKYAYTYFGMLEEAKIELTKSINQENKSFEDVNLYAFSTQDILLGQANYASGILKENIENLQPYVIFYKLEFLKLKGDTAGSSYKYWVNINGKWIFVPHKLL